MTEYCHQFVCIDCGVNVVVWGGVESREHCYNCRFVNHMELPPKQEMELRKVLGCEREEKAE